MSDFDKEAEREKLREKYERDQEDREATKRMSDLLLKGATMTNTHCDVCGDPLFQQNGTTFCPSCHGGPEGVEATTPDGTTTDDATSDGTTTDRPATSEATATDEGATGASATDVTASAEASEAEPTNGGDERPTADRSRDGTSATERASRTETPTPDRPARPTRTPPAGSDAGSDLETARASLVTALERFAGEAAATDDPRYARECLEAAHEAADALAALDQ